MHTKLALIMLTTALCAGNTAYATPLVLNVSGNLTGTNPNDMGTLSGTVTFDMVTGNATAANIAADIDGHPLYFTFVVPAIIAVTAIPPQPPIDPPPNYSFVQNGFTTVEVVDCYYGVQPLGCESGAGLNFEVSDALLTSPAGDPFVSEQGPYLDQIYQYRSLGGTFLITDDMLTAPSTPTPTPEPSSLVLLGTGMVALAEAVRRRFN